ncbi:uroporphyrinogen-III synthase [Episyrphus balteatus]|uniref:uroporphyrinogen-III synthase n=1 Tax=Episyrphus balteatus TaxID=286459 RepID=UPI002486C56B|nr:uroporphyrinogen-III synthase [Episyrphus balteatus]
MSSSTTTMKPRTVIVLKSESDSTDTYAQLLRENNFNAIFVPTLGFGFKKLDELRQKLINAEQYAGVIFTSPRCIEAVIEALQQREMPKSWHLLHNFSVGEVTHNLAMTRLQQLFTRGKETGNASALADFIIETFDGDKEKPFLLPCGNLRTDILLSKLGVNGFLVDAVEVYETICHPELGETLDRALKEENVEFLAFFSPSGVNCTVDHFAKNNLSFEGKKLIAIGPSTRKCIEERGLTVYRTAERPSVEYLIKVLINPDDCRLKLED